MDGKWYGNTFRADSIKYTYFYKKGEIKERVGYDKSGTAYSFENIHESTECVKGTVFFFLQSIRNNLKLPPGADKPDIDTMHACFIIQKDGSVSNFHVLGNLSPEIKEAFANALKPGSLWSPGKYYGVPFRTMMVIPFDVIRTTTTKTQILNASSNPMSMGYNQPKYKYTTTTMQKQVYGSQKLLDFE